MLTAQFDVQPGLDPSSLTSLTQTQLLQMIQQIGPLSNIGGIIVGAGASLNAAILQGSTSPSVTNNPRFARYIWLNTFAAASAAPTPYYYDASTSLWRSTSVAAGSIIDASISATAEIQVSKLQDGNANEIIVTDGAGTGVEWKSVATLLAALNDSVPLTAIDDTGAAGAESFLRRVGSTVIWKTFTETVTAIQNALTGVPVTTLTPGANNTFLGTNGAGVVAFDTFNNLVTALGVDLQKLAQGGAATGDLLYWNGTSWVKITPSLDLTNGNTYSTTGTLGAINLGSATLTENFAHGFGSTPRLVRVVVRCTAADAATGYGIGDEIDVSCWEEIAGADASCFAITANATNVVVSRVSNTANVIVVPKAGGNPVTPTALSNFTPKVYAWL